MAYIYSQIKTKTGVTFDTSDIKQICEEIKYRFISNFLAANVK